MVDRHVPRGVLDTRHLGLHEPEDGAVAVVVLPYAVVLPEVVAHDGVVLAVEHPLHIVVVPGDAHAQRALVEHVEVGAQAVRVLLSEDVEVGAPEDGAHEVVGPLHAVVGVPRLAAGAELALTGRNVALARPGGRRFRL